ncbi:exodeoxyribonuclease V alpha subunit [Desulfonauticus submarinus]|uniref:Exodeoxyribonuclease V alpha subunit n=1 Tax=Desulfonauticus submarinus TaxID=206665 RepID=A0A1H0EBP7_9BACT|nr:ATP-dependent RecD-like DNA helicase [Desulfonauticus submarinus]SDN79748.1 exodeoxyribonuclease V alpha subunit [Desulfonauticus submarinus]
MEILQGEIKKIIFLAQDTGYVVFLLKVSKDNVITVCGYGGDIYEGEEVEVCGRWKKHPKYGRQFWIEKIRKLEPITINAVERFLCSNLIKGVGPKLGKLLIEKFGTDILNILEDSPEKLLQVQGIGPKKLKTIVDSWKTQKQIRELALFLQTYGISTAYLHKIVKKYGEEAIFKIKQNPYALARDIRGIGFKRADQMALKLGLSKESFFRLEAAVIYVLKELSEKGHFFYPEEDLVEELQKLLDISSEVILNALLELEAQSKIFVLDLKEQGIKRAVYLAYFYKQEQEIASRIFHLATFSIKNKLTPEDKLLIEDLEKQENIVLSTEQKEAIFKAIENKFFILTGGPGTGKTTIVRFIVEFFKQKNLKLKLCAPTGRAAKRLEESTGFSATTIHRLLKARPEGGFELGEEQKLNTDVLIIDEASMLDGPLFLAVLRALPLNCRLILVGDINQLPAIGPGNILTDLLKSEVVAYHFLTDIFRQARESLIILNAHRINQGKLPVKTKLSPPKADFFWIEQDDNKKILDLILKMVLERIPKVYGFSPRDEVQVLTPMHKGDLGTINLNYILQKYINPPTGNGLKKGGVEFFVGDRVIQLANNYDKQVFNGDLGVIIEIDAQEDRLIVDFDGREVEYFREDLDELNLAYAISVHKSQGSEFPVVILPITTAHFILLQRNLIYTGLTRAKKLAILIGSKKAMFIGLKKTGQEKRYTHLRFRLQNLFNF